MPVGPPLLLRNKHGKPTRPFKAYPRDPLSLPIGFYSPLVPSSDNVLNVLASSTDEFGAQFRKRIQQAQERLVNRFQDSPSKASSASASSQEKILSPSSTSQTIPPKKRYRPNTPPPEISSIHASQTISQDTDTKDDAYWERRRKNNEAAKRSRDARRAKEDEIALRYYFATIAIFDID
jgi:protein giant